MIFQSIPCSLSWLINCIISCHASSSGIPYSIASFSAMHVTESPSARNCHINAPPSLITTGSLYGKPGCPRQTAGNCRGKTPESPAFSRALLSVPMCTDRFCPCHLQKSTHKTNCCDTAGMPPTFPFHICSPPPSSVPGYCPVYRIQRRRAPSLPGHRSGVSLPPA